MTPTHPPHLPNPPPPPSATSPPRHPPSSPSSRIVQQGLVSSNSTANLFLGGVRRSWMLDASAAPGPGSSPSAPRTRRQGLQNNTSPRMPPISSSSPPNNVASASPSTSAPVPSVSGGMPVPMNAIASATATASPITTTAPPPQQQQFPPSQNTNISPSRNLPPLNISAALPASASPVPTPTSAVTTSFAPAPSQQAAPLPQLNRALPSQTSPGGVIFRQNGPSPDPMSFSPPPTARPGPHLQSQQTPSTWAGGRGERNGSNLSPPAMRDTPGWAHGAAGAGPMNSGLRQTNAMPQQNLAHHSPASVNSPAMASLPTPPATQMGPSPGAPSTLELIPKAHKYLTGYNSERKARSGPSRTTEEEQRMNLLSLACANQDTLYLAIHQLYCLHSLSPSAVYRLPCFTEKQARGLMAFQSLLVTNQRLPGEVLGFFASFPIPIETLLQVPDYLRMLEQAAMCLGKFDDNWIQFEQSVRARDYPPLVDELFERFAITSRTLLAVICRALGRRLNYCRLLQEMRSPELAKVEDRQHAIWEKDMRYFQERFPMRVDLDTNPQIEEIIQAYRAIPASLGVQSHLPSASPRHSNSPRVTAPAPNVSYEGPTPTPTTTRGPRIRFVTNASGGGTNYTGNAPSPHPGTSPQVSTPTFNNPTSSTAYFAPFPSGVRPNQMHQQQVGAPLNVAPSRAAAHPQVAASFNPMLFPSQLVSPSNSGRAAPVQQHPAQFQARMALRPDGRAEVVTTRPPQQRVSHSLLLPPAGRTNMARGNPHLGYPLHQAHLREPFNRLVSRGAGQWIESELFQYLKCFAVPPALVCPGEDCFDWKVTLTEKDCKCLPHVQRFDPGQRPLRTFIDGTHIYRLRCIKVKTGPVSESEWSVAEVSWPSAIYILVNGTSLEVRRHGHFGKDLPLDITEHLRQGDNEISCRFIFVSDTETKDHWYAVGVEVLDIASYLRTVRLASLLPASQSRDKIRNRLSSSSSEDDELSIVSEDLTINLVDPFTARIFDSPVRGQSCQHLECFDHSTWIQTRASKSGKAPLKEDWRCPICGKDARPQSLVIDCFLVEVHAELKRTNRLEGARAIKVRADGSWELKTDADRQSTERNASADIGLDRQSSKRKSTSAENPNSQRAKLEQTQSPSLASRGPASSSQPPPVIPLD